MFQLRLRFDALILVVVSAGSLHAQTAAVSPVVADEASRKALVNRYCLGCHNSKLNTAGISLQGLDVNNPGDHAMVWEKVLRKVKTAQMPPVGLPHPDAKTNGAFSTWLEGSLDSAAAANPNPGRPVIHRLNRTEYSNAIRDLLALDINAGSTLPIDDSGYGFDNIGDVLSVSPVLLERYMSAARRVSRLAVGDQSIKPSEERFDAPRDVIRRKGAAASRNERVSDNLPFGSRGGLSVRYYFPLDAEYVLRVRTTADSLAAEAGKRFEIRLPMKAGLHEIGVAFLRESARPEISSPLPSRAPAPAKEPVAAGLASIAMDLRIDDARVERYQVPRTTLAANPDISGVSITGPYNVQGRGETPSREKIFVCRPGSPGEERACAEKVLAALSRRAFRRSVTSADLRPLLTFYEAGRKERDFDYGIQKAIQAMLVSPDFLFRAEQDQPKGKAGSTASYVSEYELASRLSFFLWSSIPDDTLLDLAERSQLRKPDVLAAQVRRMMDDARSDALIINFAGQWLYLRNLATVKPDPDEFPDFDDSLRRAFERETELFFASIVREDRSVLNLLDADYTFLNERVADHYGVPRIYGSQFRRVQLADPNRGGLLGQGSILTVTSYPNRTSVVQRGKWVLDNLLGSPPPPPPPDIPDLKPHGKDGKQVTIRQAMEQHRTNPTCAACHSRMDPIGFALENYDGIGKWRTKEASNEIDSSGKLPDGTTFKGPAGLKKILLTAHKDEFVDTVTEKLLTYGLGRGLEYYDQPALRAITREAAKDDYRISALITAIVKSTPFQMRRTLDQ